MSGPCKLKLLKELSNLLAFPYISGAVTALFTQLGSSLKQLGQRYLRGSVGKIQLGMAGCVFPSVTSKVWFSSHRSGDVSN